MYNSKGSVVLITIIVSSLVIITLVVIYFLKIYNQRSHLLNNQTDETLQKNNEIYHYDSNIGTNTPASPPPLSFSKKSPDGSKIVVLKLIDGMDKSINIISIMEPKKGDHKELYSEDLGMSEGIIIPDNTWSDNNRLLFVIKSGPDYIDPIIFDPSGEIIPNREYIDVGKIFYKQTNLLINGEIKWLSSDEISFSTTSKGLSPGPSYVFNIRTHTFSKN